MGLYTCTLVDGPPLPKSLVDLFSWIRCQDVIKVNTYPTFTSEQSDIYDLNHLAEQIESWREEIPEQSELFNKALKSLGKLEVEYIYVGW